jgi:hypothetical protein
LDQESSVKKEHAGSELTKMALIKTTTPVSYYGLLPVSAFDPLTG